MPPLIQDHAIIFFDEWTEIGWEGLVQGERQAFREFLEAHPEFAVTPLSSYSSWTATFLLSRRVEGGRPSDAGAGRHRPSSRPSQQGKAGSLLLKRT